MLNVTRCWLPGPLSFSLTLSHCKAYVVTWLRLKEVRTFNLLSHLFQRSMCLRFRKAHRLWESAGFWTSELLDSAPCIFSFWTTISRSLTELATIIVYAWMSKLPFYFCDHTIHICGGKEGEGEFWKFSLSKNQGWFDWRPYAFRVLIENKFVEPCFKYFHPCQRPRLIQLPSHSVTNNRRTNEFCWLISLIVIQLW